MCTNINHKGPQRTANECAEERRIYKDLISKNSNVDIKLCKQNTAMLIVLREINSARHQHDTETELKRERDCSHRQLFRPLWGLSVWRPIFYDIFYYMHGGSSTEKKTFLGSNSYWETCYQVKCSVPSLPTQQVELIWMEMSTRHLFFKFFLFVFHLFSIFQKK